jgi:hypothetical protein
MFKKALLAGGLLIAASATNASASILWDFSFADAGGDVASGQFITGNVGSPYQVTGISGVFDGQTIISLDGGYGGPDNELFVPPAYVDSAGISFDLGAGPISQVNVWWNGAQYELDLNPPDSAGSGPDAGPLTSFTVTETPLPSTWTMLLIGFSALGFFAFQGTKSRSAIAAA